MGTTVRGAGGGGLAAACGRGAGAAGAENPAPLGPLKPHWVLALDQPLRL